MQIQVEKNHHGVIISVSSRLQKKRVLLLGYFECESCMSCTCMLDKVRLRISKTQTRLLSGRFFCNFSNDIQAWNKDLFCVSRQIQFCFDSCYVVFKAFWMHWTCTAEREKEVEWSQMRHSKWTVSPLVCIHGIALCGDRLRWNGWL